MTITQPIALQDLVAARKVAPQKLPKENPNLEGQPHRPQFCQVDGTNACSNGPIKGFRGKFARTIQVPRNRVWGYIGHARHDVLKEVLPCTTRKQLIGGVTLVAGEAWHPPLLFWQSTGGG